MVGATPPLGHPFHPVPVAWRTGRSVLVAQVDDRWRRAAAFDDAHYERMREQGLSSVLAVVVSARGRRYGVLTFCRARDSDPYGERDLATAEELARRIGASLENARLYREARAAAEAQRRIAEREAFYARLGEALAETLDLHETLAAAARLLVPAFADWVVVNLIDADGALVLAASQHRDPATTERTRALLDLRYLSADAAGGSPEVVRTKRPLVYPQMPADGYRRGDRAVPRRGPLAGRRLGGDRADRLRRRGARHAGDDVRPQLGAPLRSRRRTVLHRDRAPHRARHRQRRGLRARAPRRAHLPGRRADDRAAVRSGHRVRRAVRGGPQRGADRRRLVRRVPGRRRPGGGLGRRRRGQRPGRGGDDGGDPPEPARRGGDQPRPFGDARCGRPRAALADARTGWSPPGSACSTRCGRRWPARAPGTRRRCSATPAARSRRCRAAACRWACASAGRT